MIWRWREDAVPGDPWANMATDLALFEEVVRGASAQPIVRIYRWDRPSVSIGRLQEADAVARAFPDLPAVRRPTGGRAVVHGQDLTVSVITRVDWLPRVSGGAVLSSYRQIVAGLIDAFTAIGVSAQMGEQRRSAAQKDIVDCFGLAASCDLVEASTGRKLLGAAQRREGGVILQQMSIRQGTRPEWGVFSGYIKDGLGRALGVTEWVSVDFTPPV